MLGPRSGLSARLALRHVSSRPARVGPATRSSMTSEDDTRSFEKVDAVVKSARRVALILRLLAACPQGLSLAEVVRRLQIPRSSTTALLRDLVQTQLVETAHGPRGPVFRIGILAFEVGSAYLSQRDLNDEAREVVHQISASLIETAHLAVLDGSDVVYVAKAESNRTMRVGSAVGRRLPAHATAVGKALLAYLDPAEFLIRYPNDGLRIMTARTIPDRSLLQAELNRVRERGFAFDDEESTPDIQCLAVPVFGSDGRVVAALSLSIPTVRMARLDQSKLLAGLCDARDEMSRRLGWVVSTRRSDSIAARHRPQVAASLHPARDLGDAVES